MSNNWILVDEYLLKAKYEDLLRASEQEKLVRLSGRPKKLSFHAKILIRFGDHLVDAGTWLQRKFGGIPEFNALGMKKQV